MVVEVSNYYLNTSILTVIDKLQMLMLYLVVENGKHVVILQRGG